MTDLLLEATGVAKHYGAVAALRSASLAVRPGEVHALMGANGAGKSTLVKILTGAVHPDRGTIARPRHTVSWPVRRARLAGAGSCPCTRSRRSSPTSTSPSNLRLTRTPVEPFRALAGGARHPEPRPDDRRAGAAARDAAGHRPRPCARHRARRADARRDDRRPAGRPDRARPRGHRRAGAAPTARSSSSRTG